MVHLESSFSGALTSTTSYGIPRASKASNICCCFFFSYNKNPTSDDTSVGQQTTQKSTHNITYNMISWNGRYIYNKLSHDRTGSNRAENLIKQATSRRNQPICWREKATQPVLSSSANELSPTVFLRHSPAFLPSFISLTTSNFYNISSEEYPPQLLERSYRYRRLMSFRWTRHGNSMGQQRASSADDIMNLRSQLAELWSRWV